MIRFSSSVRPCEAAAVSNAARAAEHEAIAIRGRILAAGCCHAMTSDVTKVSEPGVKLLRKVTAEAFA